MKWHLAHRHEIPTAFDALGKDYEAKTTSLQEENAGLKKKMEQLERELAETGIALRQEKEENLKATAQITQLSKDQQIMALAIVVRNRIIKERLNIEVPNPSTQ
jgi:peptidoglycan hydrolase CwlO-like protein